MSWFNQVKFFYTSTITLLMTFVWSTIIAMIFNEGINLNLFFLIILISNIGIRFLRKGIDPRVCLMISMAPIVLFETLTSKEVFLAVLDCGFSLILLIKLFGEEKCDVNYEEYKREFIKGIFGVFAVSVIYNLTRWSNGQILGSEIYVGIIVYIILVIISLRESMAYEYQIKRDKISKYINYGLVFMGMLITQPFIYNPIIFVINLFITMARDILLWIILLFLKYPLMWAFNLIKIPEDKIPLNLESVNSVSEVIDSATSNGGVFIINFIVGILISIFLYYIYKAIKKIYYKSGERKHHEYTEVVEDIHDDEVKRKSLFNSLKKILRKKGNPRDEIIYKYSELVEMAEKKELFKRYMTPKQLKYVIKIKVKSSEGIHSVTDLYNEAKFSKHEMKREEENYMVENVNKLKKTMK